MSRINTVNPAHTDANTPTTLQVVEVRLGGLATVTQGPSEPRL